VTLTYCPDLTAADWIATSTLDWARLVTFGPAGFDAYARLRFIPDPVTEGQSENDIDYGVTVPESDQIRVALETLGGYTRTPEDCYFCLWDGWGSELLGTPPRIAPAFPPSVLDGPKLGVPHREFYLFRGPLSDFGDWGAADMWPGQPRFDMPPPAFVWPADHAWCVTRDVDPHWAGIGAPAGAIDRLCADTRIDVVPADPAQSQPAYR
jgi:hypothetical protein